MLLALLLAVELELLLIIDGLQDKSISEGETAVAVKFVGTESIVELAVVVEVVLDGVEVLLPVIELVVVLAEVSVTVMVPDMPTPPGAPWYMQ